MGARVAGVHFHSQRMAQRKSALARKLRGLEKFITREAAMRDGGVGAPHNASLPLAERQQLAIMRSPQFGRRDAVVIEQNSSTAAVEKRQQRKQGVEMSVLDDNQIRCRQERPIGLRRAISVQTPATRLNSRVQLLLRFHEHADVGTPVEKEGELFRDLIANGVAGLSVVAKKCNPHGGRSLDIAEMVVAVNAGSASRNVQDAALESIRRRSVSPNHVRLLQPSSACIADTPSD